MMDTKFLHSFLIFCSVFVSFLVFTVGNPVPEEGTNTRDTSFDEGVIALLKENAEKLPSDSFEHDIVLLQHYDESSGQTAYISPTIQKPMYVRKGDDREQNVVVLSRKEDFTNNKQSIKKKNYFVLLRKIPGETEPQKYNPFVAYLRGTYPKDTDNTINIAGKKRTYEWDQWEEKMSPLGNPISAQALFCISSFLVPCGTNLEILRGPNITKSMRYVPKIPSEKDMQTVKKAKYESDEKKQAGRGIEGILGGGGGGGDLISSLLGGILGGGEGGGGLLGGILGGEGGGLLGGILGGGKDGEGGLLSSLLGGIFGGGEGGGGLLGGILGGEGGGLLGGILGGGEDGGGGIIGGVLGAAGGIVCSVFGIFGGGGCGKKKQTKVVNVVQHVNVPMQHPGMPMPPPGMQMQHPGMQMQHPGMQMQPGMMVMGRKKKEVAPDSVAVSLLDFPGWKTQFVTAKPGIYQMDSQEIFHGFGNCPSPSVGKEELEKATTNEEIVDFYLTVLRAECVVWMKPAVLKMIGDEILEVKSKALSMTNNPVLKKPKLNMQEAIQISSAAELCALTHSYLEEINVPTVAEPKSPDEKLISRSIDFFVRSTLKSLMKTREFARLHIIRLTKNIISTTNMVLLKLSEDTQNLKICGKECDIGTEINYNDRVMIIALQQFIKHGLGPVETGNNALEAFKKFYLYKNNLEYIQFETNIRT